MTYTWFQKFRKDPNFGHMKFKILIQRTPKCPDMGIDADWIIPVDKLDFAKRDDDRIAVLFDTVPIGRFPEVTRIPGFLKGTRIVAIFNAYLHEFTLYEYNDASRIAIVCFKNDKELPERIRPPQVEKKKVYTVIPHEPHSIIAEVKDGSEINEIGTLDIPYDAVTRVSDSNILVTLCPVKRELLIHDLSSNLIARKDVPPYNTLVIKKETVFLGGKYPFIDDQSGGELCSYIDLNDPELKRKDLPLPVEIFEGKSIDDILIDGDRMVLVDNLVFPKYLFEFDIRDPNVPVYKRLKELRNNGVYEHIYKGDMNSGWLVIWSSCTGMAGTANFISVYGKRYGRIALDYNMVEHPDGYNPFYTACDIRKEVDYFHDICLLGHYLYILRSSGLGYLDLYQGISLENIQPVTVSIGHPDRLLKLDHENLLAVRRDGYEVVSRPI